jgi:hypothetical protein
VCPIPVGVLIAPQPRRIARPTCTEINVDDRRDVSPTQYLHPTFDVVTIKPVTARL